MKRIAVFSAMTAMVLAMSALAYADQPVERISTETRTHHDFVNDLVAFWNTDRSGFCANAEGAPSLTETVHEAGEQGRFTSASGTVGIELWDISGIADQNGDSCSMTSQDGAQLWATGEVQVTLTGREPPNSGSSQPFRFSFRDQGRGTIEDVHGMTWDYGWIFQMLQQEQGFLVASQHFTLKPSD